MRGGSRLHDAETGGEMKEQAGMSRLERRAGASLAGIFVFRMLGLFLILPVFALYAEHLAGTTPLLVGIAIGAYGLTQAILQIPFGMLSDHIGRKPVIVAGLLLFALGSVIAARADSIWGVILGRAIQGSGAVAAAIMALAADLTREEHRTKVMAMIGMSIGMAFALALVLGPILNDHIGVPGIFWVTAGLAVAGILIILFAVPTPPRSSLHRDAEAVPALLARVFRDGQLLRLDFGIFTLHMMLTSVFLALPLSLRDAGLAEARHWLLYLPVLIGSMLLMIPFVIAAEKYGRMKSVFLFAVALLALASIIFWQGAHALWALTLGLVVFFTAFNILEATLPSLVSRFAPADGKGSAMGVYSTSQFLGAFAGGAIGGWAHQHFGVMAVYLATAAVALLWLGVAAGMRKPRKLRNRVLKVSASNEDAVLGVLRELEGVVEVAKDPTEPLLYLKYDADMIEDEGIEAALSAY